MPEPDFNLLRVFDVLFEQRSVTKTAERLNLTQSAVSHALGRLRNMFDDPLFVRTPGGVSPTARAEEIAPAIRDGLNRLRGVFSPADFDPSTATRRFTIAASNYFCDLLIPTLLERIRLEAPHVTIRLVPVGEGLKTAMDRGLIDLTFAGHGSPPSPLRADVLFMEEMVWIAASDNRICERPFNPVEVPVSERLVVSVARPLEMSSPSDDLVSQIFPRLLLDVEAMPDDGLTTVYDSQTAISVVARTRAIAIVPLRLARRAQIAGQITILSGPVATSPIQMLWHSKHQADGGMIWLRRLVRECAT